MIQELDELLRPVWGAEKWIMEGWKELNAKEKESVRIRMESVFKDGLPFQLKHDKLLYIYTFSLLAQLEVLAIQVPLKFSSSLSLVHHRKRMRTQLLDEVFHGLVFTRIVYMLSAPLAEPPPYNESIEALCDFIRHEHCPKMALMLLNLVAEGWIEELFKSLRNANIAPKVFDIIIDDEHRHVSEAELYRDIGLPDGDKVREKLTSLEAHLLTGVFMQYKYVMSVSTLLGVEGVLKFIAALDQKHTRQLEKVSLKPTADWAFFMAFWKECLPAIERASLTNYEISMTPIRQVFMTQWGNPSDPTMSGRFDIDVTSLDFFGNTFPKETLTTLMLQALSEMVMERGIFRRFLSFNRLYQSDKAYMGIVVKLPECGDQIGTIVFEDCHLLRVETLALRIREVMGWMTYCFKRREALEAQHPEFQTFVQDGLVNYLNDGYGYPLPGYPFVSVSSIGFCGFKDCMSPLRRNEALKFTLLMVEKKQIWNRETNTFEARDILPVSISADHRIYDANTPVPKLTAECFDKAFLRMIHPKPQEKIKSFADKNDELIESIEKMISKNPELAFRTLLVLQTYWFDFLSIEEVLKATGHTSGFADILAREHSGG